MNTHTPGSKSIRSNNRRFIRLIQIFSWGVTGIFLVALALTIYQALILGNPLPLWAWAGLFVILAVAVGLGVMVVVYQGIRREAGPFDYRPSTHLTGELVHAEQHLTLEGAASIAAKIMMLQGTMQLLGGESERMDLTFTFDDADWKAPQVDYGLDAAGQAHITVNQQASHRAAMRPGRNEWLVKLPETLPIELALKFGAGKAELRLGGLQLVDLQVESGVGELLLDFIGEWRNSLTANIKTGIGDTHVRLPADVGLRIESMLGFGSLEQEGLIWDGEAYTNTLYGQSPITLELIFEGGMGKIRLEMDHG